MTRYFVITIAAMLIAGTTAADARRLHHRHVWWSHHSHAGRWFPAGNAAGAGNHGNSFSGSNSLANPNNMLNMP